MTSTSTCEHMWSITGWIHSKHRNRLTRPTVKKTVRVHDNLVLRKVMMDRNKNVVFSDSQTVITKPDSYTDEQVTDDIDEEDSEDEKLIQKSTISCGESAIFWDQKEKIPQKMDSLQKINKQKNVFVSDAGRLTTVVS